jgi:hypothetical protein
VTEEAEVSTGRSKSRPRVQPSAAAVPPRAPSRAAASRLPPEQMREVLVSRRFLAADRTTLGLGEIGSWDKYLVREQRLLVPMDVQALVVPPGGTEAMVRLPMLLAGGVTDAASAQAAMPEPFTAGSPRAPGVHLHWAMPDALLRGRLSDKAGRAGNRFGLAPLPDRFLVLRFVQPRGGRDLITTGWIVEADRAVAMPLAQWREGQVAGTPAGEALAPGDLVGTAGGDLQWTAAYDAVLNRFALHDPLADLATLAPGGVDGNCASYLVCGWWSDPRLDPLDGARDRASLDELLASLRWHPLLDWGRALTEQQREAAEAELRRSLGLTQADAYEVRPLKRSAVQRAASAAAQAPGFGALASLTPQPVTLASTFAVDAAKRFTSPPWQLRSSLLHGAVFGVPVAGGVPVDGRPAAATVAVALGWHDHDVLGAFAADGASDAERRGIERLLAAFTAQKVNRLGAADGLVEIEEHEHAAGFASLPAGRDGTDRFQQRVQTGGVGGLKVGRDHRDIRQSGLGDKSTVTKNRAAAAPQRAVARAAGGTGTQLLFTSEAKTSKAQLQLATPAQIDRLARSRVGDVLSAVQARIVDRPAPRWALPIEPMVAVRGAVRSLRHGGDGRASADGTLACRWPQHVVDGIGGVIEPGRFIERIDHGGVPPECLRLAREAVLLDPYHDAWIARALAPPGADTKLLQTRLHAESLLRFGSDGTYDGATAMFSRLQPQGAPRERALRSAAGRAALARVQAAERSEQQQVAEQLRRFSLYDGADPSPVGVTAWTQPWIPLWLEWEASAAGLDPADLAGWPLGAIDLEGDHAGPGIARTLVGRSALTTGAATTLSEAIRRFLEAEDALDAVQAGLVDDDTAAAYRELEAAVSNLDVATATLSGLRSQLLGLPAEERRAKRPDGSLPPPAPSAAPAMLLAGHVRLTRARLLDAFGRTLDLPVAGALAPSRLAVAGVAGALAYGPRLLRPARWAMRWVEAGTEVGTQGTQARVDQVEPSLQVNPVAGFLLPDHLDESLEVFAVDGSPLGEFLHEAVSGGVTWEIAAGREGPADAAPLYDLSPSQMALGRLASGLVAADAAARGGQPLGVADAAAAPPRESALSALLRAVDTTLWSVDTMASLGSEHVAGLVGRPIAVVRAQLRLELRPPDDVDLSDPVQAQAWQQAERDAQRHAFPVRIGEVTRSDDGVLGFFVDDDYSRLRLVDKVIAAHAVDAGRGRGRLGLFGAPGAGQLPPHVPLDHPYLLGTDDADTLSLHIGQTVTLTLLMHPGGKCTLTSGVLPRKQLALARDWVGPGLAAIAPSLRTGPVLVETDLAAKGQVRLPKVSVFGKNQNFLWRDTPATWRRDAILAATQTALLPDEPAELREGWIRVAPDEPEGGDGRDG